MRLYPGIDRCSHDMASPPAFRDDAPRAFALPRRATATMPPSFAPVRASRLRARHRNSVQVVGKDSGFPGIPCTACFTATSDTICPLTTSSLRACPTEADKRGISTTASPAKRQKNCRSYWSRERAAMHAGNFMFTRVRQIEFPSVIGAPSHCVAPYDADFSGTGSRARGG
jgi:1,4-alpha-glucan branching enzyme